MSSKKKLVVLISYGLDDERASVAWSIANGGIKSGLEVSIFLLASRGQRMSSSTDGQPRSDSSMYQTGTSSSFTS